MQAEGRVLRGRGLRLVRTPLLPARRAPRSPPPSRALDAIPDWIRPCSARGADRAASSRRRDGEGRGEAPRPRRPRCGCGAAEALVGCCGVGVRLLSCSCWPGAWKAKSSYRLFGVYTLLRLLWHPLLPLPLTFVHTSLEICFSASIHAAVRSLKVWTQTCMVIGVGGCTSVWVYIHTRSSFFVFLTQIVLTYLFCFGRLFLRAQDACTCRNKGCVATEGRRSRLPSFRPLPLSYRW